MAILELDREALERQVLGSELWVVVDFYANWRAVPAGGARPGAAGGQVGRPGCGSSTSTSTSTPTWSSAPDFLDRKHLVARVTRAGSSLGAKPATALERDLGLTDQGEQAEPSGGRTGRSRLRRSIQAGWNSS
jgi:hypothetical protein